MVDVMNRQTRRTSYGTWLGAYAIYTTPNRDAPTLLTTETRLQRDAPYG